VKRLVLVGGGHAHLSVLERLIREKAQEIEVVLVTPSRFQIYSGMLPGWMVGHYVQAQCQIDLQALAQRAGARVVTQRIVTMTADRNQVELADGQTIEYDLLSLDVGSEIDLSSLEMARARLLPVKPLDEFFHAWPRILASARARLGYRLVVVGGGAAGVELSLAARHAFMRSGFDARVDLVASALGLLVGHAASARRRLRRILAAAGVVVHDQQAAGAEGGVILSDGALLPADCVIAATGARAPRWFKSSGLKLDVEDYVAVDGYNRSVSHENVFAAGDAAARQDISVARSGVHAVHSGPVLAGNLLASLRGGAMQTYLPRRHSLYLLACGPRYAVASWGNWSAEGAWVWHWKDWIDRGFVRRFESVQPEAPESPSR
jgi:pyridine nucleotide-disulfide oxidoreductase family protein